MGKEGGPPCHPALVWSHSGGFHWEKSLAASCSCRCLSQNIPSAHVMFQAWPMPGGSLPSPLPMPPGPLRGRQPEMLPPLAAVTEPISLLTGTWAPTRHPLPWDTACSQPNPPCCSISAYTQRLGAVGSPLPLGFCITWGKQPHWGQSSAAANVTPTKGDSLRAV